MKIVLENQPGRATLEISYNYLVVYFVFIRLYNCRMYDVPSPPLDIFRVLQKSSLLLSSDGPGMAG